jgi:signal transduction histidine kinase/ligand-binding sensor domain-containing protein
MSGLTRVLIILVVLGIRTALALDPDRHITELAHRVWDSTSGVPADIRALAQTTDGYLWLGGYRGLYRFDGIQFQPFESVSAARLPSHEVRSLFATSDGRLWIGYRWGGVSVLERGKVVNYNSVDGFPEGAVWGFAQDPQGRIWVASLSGLACFEHGRWHTVGNESGFPGSRAQAVLVDHLGALWVAGKHRIAVLRPHASKFELADEPYDGQIARLAESPDGTVWMAETTRAVRPLIRPGQALAKGPTKADCQNRFPNTWQTEPRCRRPDDLEVRVGSIAMLFDRNGSFWITTIGDGLRRAPYPSRLLKEPIGEFSSTLEQFTNKEGLSSDFLTAILEDREGNIWVGTRDAVEQFRNAALAPVTLGPDTGFSIAPADTGYVVAVSNNGYFFRFHDAHNKMRVTGRDTRAYWLYRDPFGSIWGSGAGGGCRLVGDQCATRLEFPIEKSGSAVRGLRLAVDGHHRLWAYVAEQGLFAFEDGRWSRFNGVPTALTSAVPTTQYTDAEGRVWFGSQDGRLLTITEGVAHGYSLEDGLTLGEIKAIASVGTHVWVGGERGLVLLRGERFAPVLPYDAPAFGSVSGVVADDDGSLWLNENRGVIRVPPSEVSAILQDSSHRTLYDVFDSLDGVPGATERIYCPTAIRGTDGRLWFTATKGAAWVDPQHLYRNRLPPPVVIQSVVADGKMLSSFPGRLELPARTRNLQIAYAGLSLSVPERVQYRYRLKGVDDTWQNAGTRRTAYYTKLPPGSYDFQVIASNDAGVWNTVGAELPLRVIPAWYQTWWFYALCAFLGTAALAALYRLRVAQVRADTRRLLEARLSERERIARDLHDTLLQEMQGLIWRFQAATNRVSEKPARELLDQTLDRADKVLEGSRDRVKDLRPVASGVADLTQALAAEGEQLAQLHPAKFRVSVQGDPRELHPIVREEGFLIAREALRNAFRHSGAKEIEVEVTYANAAFHVRVRDDGRGISASVLEAGGTPGHFGLIGMRERAKKLGGQLEVWSRPDAGTEIYLQVPAHLAYRASQAHSPGARSLLRIFHSSAKAR